MILLIEMIAKLMMKSGVMKGKCTCRTPTKHEVLRREILVLGGLNVVVFGSGNLLR
jgi:hypothetical protein